MKNIFKRTILLALVAALGVASLPFVSVSAMGTKLGNTEIRSFVEKVTNEKLETVWARQQQTYEKIGKGFDRSDAFISKAQQLIDRAKENGKDVSAVQAALDAFCSLHPDVPKAAAREAVSRLIKASSEAGLICIQNW